MPDYFALRNLIENSVQLIKNYNHSIVLQRKVNNACNTTNVASWTRPVKEWICLNTDVLQLGTTKQDAEKQ